MTVEVGVNRRAGTGQSVTAAVFIVMAAGSIAVIPLLAANLDHRALGIAACVLTLVFWVGFIGAICCVGEIVNTPTRAFLLTSDWQLYYVHFAARDYGPAPVTKAGEIVHNRRCRRGPGPHWGPSHPHRCRRNGSAHRAGYAPAGSCSPHSSVRRRPAHCVPDGSRECGRIRWGA